MKFLGSSKKCTSIEKSISGSNEFPIEKSQPVQRISKESSCLNEQKKQIDFLKKENFVLKKKIVDLTEAYDYEQKQKSEYEDKIERLNIRIEQFEQTFSKCLVFINYLSLRD